MKKFSKKDRRIGMITSNNVVSTIEESKRSITKAKIAMGINAVTLAVTPVAVKLAADHIEDDYGKKALYVTGGILWMYQLADTINNVAQVRVLSEQHRLVEEETKIVSEIEEEGKHLIMLLGCKEEESGNE